MEIGRDPKIQSDQVVRPEEKASGLDSQLSAVPGGTGPVPVPPPGAPSEEGVVITYVPGALEGALEAWKTRSPQEAMDFLLRAPEGHYDAKALYQHPWQKGSFPEAVSYAEVMAAAGRAVEGLEPIARGSYSYYRTGTLDREICINSVRGQARDSFSIVNCYVEINDRGPAERAMFKIQENLGRATGEQILARLASLRYRGEGQLRQIDTFDDPDDLLTSLGLAEGVPGHELKALRGDDEFRDFLDNKVLDALNDKLPRGSEVLVDWDKTFHPEIRVYFRDSGREPEPDLEMAPDRITCQYDHHLSGVLLTDCYGREEHLDEGAAISLRHGLPLDQVETFEQGTPVVITDPGYFLDPPTPGKDDPECAAVSRDGKGIVHLKEILVRVEQPEEIELAFLRVRKLMGQDGLRLDGYPEQDLEKAWHAANAQPDLKVVAQVLTNHGYQLGPAPLVVDAERLDVGKGLVFDLGKIRTEGIIQVEFAGANLDPIVLAQSAWGTLMPSAPEQAATLLVAERMAQLGIAEPPAVITESIPSPLGMATLQYIHLQDADQGPSRRMASEYLYNVAIDGNAIYADYGKWLYDVGMPDGGLRREVAYALYHATSDRVGAFDLRSQGPRDLDPFLNGELYLSAVADPQVSQRWDSTELALLFMGDVMITVGDRS